MTTDYVFASHSFEAGIEGNSIPDNTHIKLDGAKLKSSCLTCV
jgi:hypothetical protein